MRLLDKIVGHHDSIDKILNSYEAGKPGQVYLFVGPNGVGKKQVALGLAQALLCDTSRRACGKCPSCLRMAKGQHEALMLVEPDGLQIKIEQAREIIHKLSLKSMTENRVIVIDHAQSMNQQTANSLLKILEEPPEGTFFFLIAPTQSALLATIRSRSRTVQFKPVSEEDMKRVDQNLSAPWMIKSSSGSFEKLKTLREPSEQETRAKAVELLQLFVSDADFLTNETWRQAFKERISAQKYFSYWVSFIRDALCLQLENKDYLVNLDQQNLIKSLAQKDSSQLLSLVQKCLQAETAVAANQDSVLMVEKIWITEKESVHVD